jgi:hypothetical protein
MKSFLIEMLAFVASVVAIGGPVFYYMLFVMKP